METVVRDAFALVGTTLEGRFAIEEAVARGGFGIVYRGRHLTLHRPIALKVLFIQDGHGSEAHALFLESFEQEAQTIARLDHPAIVRVLDYGVSKAPNGREIPWMAMEWVEGSCLAQSLKERGGQPMTPHDALNLLKPVFHALAFAHEQRIAHRDVKPANIMLVAGRSRSEIGLVSTKLLDFGIAKAMRPDETVGSGGTSTTALFASFSLPYAAPEQTAGLKTGPWTDVHALGLILVQMLTGRRPYAWDEPMEVELQVMNPVRPTPARFGFDAGPWEAVIAKAVALRSPDRFQDAESFLAALEAKVPAPLAPLDARPPASTRPEEAPSSTTNSPRVSQVPLRVVAPHRQFAAAAAVGTLLAALVGTVVWTFRPPSLAATPTPSTSATIIAPTRPPAPLPRSVEGPTRAPPTPTPPAPAPRTLAVEAPGTALSPQDAGAAKPRPHRPGRVHLNRPD